MSAPESKTQSRRGPGRPPTVLPDKAFNVQRLADAAATAVADLPIDRVIAAASYGTLAELRAALLALKAAHAAASRAATLAACAAFDLSESIREERA